MVNRDLALDLDLFSRGGLEILRAIERQDYDVLSARPAHHQGHQAATGSTRSQRQVTAFSAPRTRCEAKAHREDGLTPAPTLLPPTLDEAYAICRSIAKREAKNFYYSFVALPVPRRNAICAIYAFMRKADDLADDESMSREERRVQLDAWLAGWRSACAGEGTNDPVFLAVRDATERFSIPLSLLDELVAAPRWI